MGPKKRSYPIKNTLIMLSLFPVFFAILILAIFSYRIMVEQLEENTKEELRLAAKNLDLYYSYDLKNDLELVDGFIEYDTEYIDSISEIGVDLTVFKENIRFMTTIKDKNGKRIEGTPASDAIWERVGKNKQEYYSEGVVINGQDYYVYYLPLTDGTNVYGMAFAGKSAARIQTAKQHMILLVLIVSVVMMLVFSILAIIVARRVSAPLNAAAAGIDRIAKGETAVNVNENSKITETIMIMDATNSLSSTLQNTISGVKDKVSELTHNAGTLNRSAGTAQETIKNLDGAANEIAKGAGSQAEEVSSSAGAVAEVLANVEEIGKHVQETNKRTVEMYEKSDIVSKQFEKLIGSTRNSQDELATINEKMKRVSGAVEAVVKAAEKINEIAGQTNLLSLNASIEAARAGDAGKGFAVVATEISNLSVESNASAEEIRNIMDTLRLETENAVKLVDGMNNTMSRQVESSDESKQALEELTEAIQKTKENVNAVKESSDQVEGLCRNLNDSINNLSAISEENAASAEETSAGITQMNDTVAEIGDMADELNNVAINLEELTDYFTV